MHHSYFKLQSRVTFCLLVIIILRCMTRPSELSAQSLDSSPAVGSQVPSANDTASFRESFAVLQEPVASEPVATLHSADTIQSSSSKELHAALELAGDNRQQIEQALAECPMEQRMALEFLVRNMPPKDLESLTSRFLLEHVAIAYEARDAARWGKQIPEEIFLNEVLPYANVNEARDDVRRQLRDQFWPIVKDFDSISVAAANLNQAVFHQTGVRYSTQRRRADQGPRETLESKTASCTGLSILLIDACRSCGIPARFVGTPRWSDDSGNHSWVEIWDNGWHFTGAAEPTGDQLDQAWFVERAAQATPGHPQHGIFAVSFRRTDLRFPLAWHRGEHHVYAVEVTKHYLKPSNRPEGTIEVRFRAFAPGLPQRCRANLVLKDNKDEVVFRGQTLDESADSNNHLSAMLQPGRYRLEVTLSDQTTSQEIVVEHDGQLITVQTVPSDSVLQRLKDWLEQECAARGELNEQPFAHVPLTRSQADEAAKLLILDHQLCIRAEREAEHQSRLLTVGEWKMPYEVRTFGQRPPNGHSLYISMHGGGGAPKRVNDQQWQNQKRLYELEEGLYVAPRAPSDTWNLWHQDHIDRLFARLIENMIAFEGIDSNRVYLTGYSAGGDGVYQLAPRLADRWAAAAMMAGHPNETQPLGLRNLPFTLHVGELDAALDRNKVAQRWSDQLAELRQSDPSGYIHWAKIHSGKGHWMDRDESEGVRWMAQFTRNMIPDRVVWLQDDVVHDRFYWLSTGTKPPREREKVVARRSGQRIEIESSDRSSLVILLRDDMLDLDQEVAILTDTVLNRDLSGNGDVTGRLELFRGRVPRTIAVLAKTLKDRGDPEAIFSAHVGIELPAEFVAKPRE